jgi:hypothetical protein
MATAYKIAASPGIRLNTAQFQFRYGTDPVKPDMIHLVLSNSRIYKLSTPAARDLYVLDRSTLKPMRGEAFSGFKSGDRWMLAIGHVDSENPSANKLNLTWFGRLEVE